MRFRTILISLSFLSLSSFGQDPGGIGTGLTFWLRADSQTSTTVDGDTVDLWEDQTASNFDAIKSIPGPLYREAGGNFNPGIDFSTVSVLFQCKVI